MGRPPKVKMPVMIPKQGEYMTRGQLLDKFKEVTSSSEWTFKRLLETNPLPFFTIGARRRYKSRDVAAWFRMMGFEPTNDPKDYQNL